METELLKYFLPAGMLDHFDVTSISEFVDSTSHAKVLKIELAEKNIIPKGYDPNEYESKGFYRPVHIKDFPVRDKALLLVVSRRRWRHKVRKNEDIRSDYKFTADGARITKDLSDFLK